MKYSAVVFLFTIILILNSNLSFSQTSYNLSGTVVNKQDSVLSINAILLNPTDTTFIKGDYFSDGHFTFNNLLTSPILLKITSIGFTDTLLLFENISSHIDLGKIILKEVSELDEVVVSASIPLFVRKEGNTIVNVENTMLGSSTSVIELLSKTPSVKVNDNTLTVFGKGEALVYLNGKQITFERLNSIPVNRITKIEVISNPTAKYDASGRAVINIITKVNTQEGINGQLTENLTKAKYFLNSTAVNLNYRKGMFSVFADYSISNGTDWNRIKSDKIISTTTDTFKTYNDKEENTKLTNISNYRLGFEFVLNNHSDISVQYDGLYNRYDLDILSLTNTKAISSENVTFLEAYNNGVTINRNNSVNLNYNNNLDTLGSNLFIGGQYCNFNTALNDQIDETISLNDSVTNRANRINDGLNVIQLGTFQVDYLKNFKNGAKLELGTKYSYTSNDGKIQFKSKQYGTENWIDYPQFSNSFLYIENIPAVYAQFHKSLTKKMNASVGARSEFSNVYGFSRTYNTKVIDTTYLNVFPSAKLSYEKSDNLSYNLSFSSRINRPNYQNIDPFVWYNDSLSSTQGNTKLIPEKNYATDFQVIYKEYSMKVGYTHMVNPMQWLPVIGTNGPNSIIQSVFNLKSCEQYYMSVEIPFGYKFWSSFNTISGTYEQVSAFSSNIVTKKPTPQLYLYSYNQLAVSNYFRLDVSGEYYSGYSDGIYTIKPTYTFAVGVSRKFLNKKLTVKIIGNDVIKSYYIGRSSQIGVIQTDTYKKLNTFFVRLTVIYKFGKLKDVNYNNKSINKEELNRINQ